MDLCAHARNMFYFEALLMLIIVLWLVKWLICEPISMKSYSGGFNYEYIEFNTSQFDKLVSDYLQ